MLRNGGFKKLWPAGTKAKSEGEFKGGRLHSEAGNLSNSEHGSRNKPEKWKTFESNGKKTSQNMEDIAVKKTVKVLTPVAS